MTTQRLSSEKLLDFSLFKNVTRRRLPHILVAFLVNFFTMSVPMMLVFGEYRERIDFNDLSYTVERALRDLSDITALNLVFTYMLAAYFGIVTLGYMMKRRSAHFYHALPQKRETLYFTSISSSLFCALAACVINLAIATVELAVFGVGFPEVYGAFFACAFNNALVFLSTYAIVVFAGTVSGNRVVQLLMSIVIMLYPFATYMGMLLMRQSHAYYFYVSYFAKDEFLQWLTPFAHVIFNYDSTVSISTTVIAVLASILLILGGLLIYKKRAIENSEKTIVFKKLGSVLKYMFMFPITIYAGMFFYTIEENAFALIFGFISGAVLSFMLFNTILEKSPKAMFKNIKGLAIFMAAFAVVALVFCFDVFDLDSYIPDEDNISHVEIDISYATFEDNDFDDPEMISALVTMLKNQREANKKNVASPFEKYEANFNVEVVMYTKLGLPVARDYRISKYTEGAEEFLKLYANDERMQGAYDKLIEKLSAHTGKDLYAELSFNLHNHVRADCDFDEFLAVYLSEAPKMNYNTLSKPAVGYVSVRYIRQWDYGTILYDIYRESGDEDIFNDLPIYENMTKTIAFLEGLEVTEGSKYQTRADITEFPEKYTIFDAKVYDIRKGVSVASASTKPRFITRLDVYPSVQIDTATAKDLYELLYKYNSGGYASITNLFMAIDTDYVVNLSYVDDTGENTEGAYEVDYGMYYEDVKVTVQSNEYQTTLVFPKGMVPDYVKGLFK